MTLALPLLLAAAFAADPLPYEIHDRALPNGMRVVVVPTPSEGVVASRIWMAVGSRDETREGETGFAHFFEHLMFHGTEARPRGAREDQLVRMGAEDNAWTWFDETVYTTLLPAEELDAFLATEADRFAHLALTPEGVRREAGAVYGEFRKSQSDPEERLTDTLYATAFATHTYRHSTIGYEADIAAMPDGFDRAEAFFAHFYTPERATLLLVGDVDAEQALALAETHFGGWTAKESEAPPPVPEEPAQEETRRAEVAWDGPTARRLALGWRVPAHDPASEDLALLELAAAYLGGRTGPLVTRLVEEEGAALDVRVGRNDFADPGLFVVTVTLKGDADPAAVEAAVREEVARLGDAVPPTLEDVRSHLLYGMLLRMEHPASLSDALGWQLRRSGEPGALATWLTTLREVPLDGLPAVAAATFVPEHLSIVTLAPAAPEEVH